MVTSEMGDNLKRIAAVTMVRNDDFYLRKWVEYYGRELGRDNLYIFFDGTDQKIADFCEGTHAELHPKIGSQVVEAEKGRLKFLSSMASRLLASSYDLVIGVDADEFIVVDPRTGKSLREYLSEQKIDVCLSALGLDFGQKLGEEQDITEDLPFLNQRHYAQIGTRYTKPSIVAKPCVWGAGFHRVKGHNFHIGKDLYLMHFGYFDKKRLEDRFSDADRLSQGWGKHMKKRSRTIRLVSALKARDFDRWTRFARICQSVVRPPYAWNKPAMFELRIVVRIPDRFKDLI
ncbi:MAG: glycosyltransferase family 2 protein [Bacteroidales bacterium]|nr:glycosyltransferase family 2 protein [Bacteroidales bacterium]